MKGDTLPGMRVDTEGDMLSGSVRIDTVGDGFAVVVSTQKEKKDFKEALSSSLPLLRLQPIQPMPTAGRSS